MSTSLKRTSLLSILALTLAAGCTSPQPPSIHYDADQYTRAMIEPAPQTPVQVVKVPEPLPLPGQLKPIEEHGGKKPEEPDPIKRVDAANEAARIEPARDGYVNAIQVHPYTRGALYRLYTAPEQVSDIALQAGENLVSVSAGDTVRWVIGDTTSGGGVTSGGDTTSGGGVTRGQGATTQVHILVKPTEADLKTNLVITTDRRTYHLELESFKNTYMASLSWRYPHDELTSLRRRNELAQAVQDRVIDTGLQLHRLRFSYTISGDTPPWRPIRAFDDGRKVYMEFPQNIAQGDAPPLFVVGRKGDAELVNYRMKGRYYVVDTLFAAAELRLGEDPQQVVRITRDDVHGDHRMARPSTYGVRSHGR